MPPSPRIARWTSRTVISPVCGLIRVLVVDDYRDGAEAIATFLSMSGYSASYILNGSEVEVAVETDIPEIALVDIDMPGMDGFEVARNLRRGPLTKDVVVIAFTAFDEIAILDNAIAAGFDGYCQKAQPLDRLLQLLDGLIA